MAFGLSGRFCAGVLAIQRSVGIAVCLFLYERLKSCFHRFCLYPSLRTALVVMVIQEYALGRESRRRRMSGGMRCPGGMPQDVVHRLS